MTKKTNLSDQKSYERIYKLHHAANIEAGGLFSTQPAHCLPESWIDIEFKEYPQSPQVALPQPAFLSCGYDRLLTSRRSTRLFGSGQMSLNELSTLLNLSAGISSTKPHNSSAKDWNYTRRYYPSAGARYPIEIYVMSLDVNGLENGLYHYNVKFHYLEMLDSSNLSEELRTITGENWAAKAQCAIAFTALLHRTINKYGDRGYRYVLIEAGHLMQNICTVSQALNINVCTVGGFIDDRLTSALGIDGSDEIPVYLAILGK